MTKTQRDADVALLRHAIDHRMSTPADRTPPYYLVSGDRSSTLSYSRVLRAYVTLQESYQFSAGVIRKDSLAIQTLQEVTREVLTGASRTADLYHAVLDLIESAGYDHALTTIRELATPDVTTKWRRYKSMTAIVIQLQGRLTKEFYDVLFDAMALPWSQYLTQRYDALDPKLRATDALTVHALALNWEGTYQGLLDTSLLLSGARPR